MKYLLLLISPFFFTLPLHSQCHGSCFQSNTLLGLNAGFSITSATHNSFFGIDAGKADTSGSYNSFFGRSTGLNNINGNENSFFGAYAGNDNISGNYNSYFGYEAGYSNESGDFNSIFGHGAGYMNSGDYNSFFGYNTGKENTNGTHNSFFGRNAGLSNMTGEDNSYFGTSAGTHNVSGSRNTYLGTTAGFRMKGNDCIAIGYNAGPPTSEADVDYRLFIDVEQSNIPLIYGEFDNDFVRINGTFEATAVGNNSDVNRKENITSIDPVEVLEKVVDLSVSEWSFKEDHVRHIGPMAQDFYTAFRIGKNETTITTIDADGIALAAIQGLYKKLEEENRIIMELLVNEKQRNDHLEASVERLVQEVQLLKKAH